MTLPLLQHYVLNPLSAILINSNFYPLEVVSRYRDTQLQVDKNCRIFLLCNHIIPSLGHCAVLKNNQGLNLTAQGPTLVVII